MIITNSQLREAFVSAQLKYYFDKKLAPMPSHEVDVLIEETLKFLNMATYLTGNIPVSKAIDEVWHYWILETQEYHTLCEKTGEGKFIHHVSNDYQEFADEDIANHSMDLTQEVAILSSYVLNFGPFELDRLQFWPLAEQLMQYCERDITKLNAWLSSASVNAPAEVVPALRRATA